MEYYKALVNSVENALRGIWIGVFIILLALLVMSVAVVIWPNGGGLALSLILTVLGLPLIFVIGVKPELLVYLGIGGGLIGRLKDEDVSQGVIRGWSTLTRWLVYVALPYGFGGLFLIVYGHNLDSPAQFWIIFLTAFMALLLWTSQVPQSLKKWLSCFLFAVFVVTLWSTLGGAYNGRAFDPNTGIAEFMVDKDTMTPYYDLSPQNCLPEGTSLSGFDYETNGTCFSRVTGRKLVPATSEMVLARSPEGWLSKGKIWITDSWDKTKKEWSDRGKKEEEAAAKQAAVDAEIAAKVAAMEAEKAARAHMEEQKQVESKIRPIAKGVKCSGALSSKKGCEQVTFRNGEIYPRTAKTGMCINATPASLVKRTTVGDSSYEYEAVRGGEVTVSFFDLEKGERYQDKQC